MPGGQVPGGQAAEAQMPGGPIPGGQLPGRTMPGGKMPAGQVHGGRFPRGQVPGGQVPVHPKEATVGERPLKWASRKPKAGGYQLEWPLSATGVKYFSIGTRAAGEGAGPTSLASDCHRV